MYFSMWATLYNITKIDFPLERERMVDSTVLENNSFLCSDIHPRLLSWREWLGSGRRHTSQIKWSLSPWTYREAIFHSHQITLPFQQGLRFLCFTWKDDIWIKQWDLSVQLPTVMGEVETDLYDVWSSPGLLDNVICPPTSTEPSAIAYKSYIWWNMWSGLLAWAGHHEPPCRQLTSSRVSTSLSVPSIPNRGTASSLFLSAELLTVNWFLNGNS